MLAEEARELHEVVHAVQTSILRFPVVAQHVFSALVAEGRAYAQTPDGEELLHALRRSRRAGQARLFWEMLSANAFTDRNEHALPRAFMERLVRAIASESLESAIARLRGVGRLDATR